MYMLIIFLHKQEFLEDILSCFIELGIEDAVTIDSESMGKALAYNVPIFAGLRFGLGGKPLSKVIYAISEDRDAGKELVKLLKQVGIDLEQPGVARIITLNVESIYGTPEVIEDI